jgi:lipopolysaccharide export system protein LptA
MRAIVLPLVACALVLAGVAARAERADRDKEIVVGADHSLADDKNKLLTFDGAVVVTQGTMRITANKMTVKEDAQGHKFYVANGAPVTFRQKRDGVDEWIEGFAQRAEFDDRDDMLKLYDRARVKSNTNEISGEFISYDMNKAVAEVTGAKPGTTAPKGELSPRVKVIIQPAKRDADKSPSPGINLKPDAGTR